MSEHNDVTFSTPYETDEVSPYISLSNGWDDSCFEDLKDADEIVIPVREIKIAFSYPLKDTFVFEFQSDNEEGFTRKGLAKIIIKQYEDIYEEEEKTSSERIETIGDWSTRMYGEVHPGALMLNRVRTSGTYEIWDHDIDDLCLHTVAYSAEKEHWILGIDS